MLGFPRVSPIFCFSFCFPQQRCLIHIACIEFLLGKYLIHIFLLSLVRNSEFVPIELSQGNGFRIGTNPVVFLTNLRSTDIQFCARSKVVGLVFHVCFVSANLPLYPLFPFLCPMSAFLTMHGMYNIVIFEPDHIHPSWFRHAESRKAS